jgi:ATP-binding cassette, subfamily C (CFTR/MRP), member 1
MNDDWAAGKGFFSRMLYIHMNPVLERAKEPNRQLQVDDLPPAPPGNSSTESAINLERTWNATPKESRPGANTQLYTALYNTFGRDFIIGGLWKIPNDAAQFCQPVLIKLLLQFISTPENSTLNVQRGFIIVAAMSALMISTSLFVQWYFQIMFAQSYRVRAALVSMIFRKSLAMSAEAKASTNEGETANLMSVDASKIADFIPYLHSLLWSLPLQILIAIVLLFMNVGWAALAGIAVMVLLIPLSAKLNSVQQGYQKAVMKLKDERISTMNELLLGIRVVKFYAWEEPIAVKVSRLRNLEKELMFKRNLVAAFQAVLFSCTPVWVTISLFSVYVGLLGNPMTPDVVFPTLVTVNLLRLPLMMLPGLMPQWTAAKQSLHRINSYLSKDELQTGVVTIPPRTDSLFDPSREPPAIKIREGFFGWTKDERDALLKNITVTFPAGKLTAVVGKTGSGKSSLLLAILGEMHMSKGGSVSNFGSVAYASQQAWIQNASVRDNILFGKPFDQSRYNAVIEACSLTTDLAIFANGDLTEIGEQGVNMSGGQKQRLNIARAIYSGGDVYMFDDPLSAVDSHVGEHIFEQCMIRYLASTTRILVTHKIDILPRCDHIVVLDDTGGRVKAQGSFQSLKDQRIDFETALKHAQEVATLKHLHYCCFCQHPNFSFSRLILFLINFFGRNFLPLTVILRKEKTILLHLKWTIRLVPMLVKSHQMVNVLLSVATVRLRKLLQPR